MQRQRNGSVVFDKRIKTWNFIWWDSGKRKSKKIGNLSDYPTKASAWRAAKTMRHSLENETAVGSTSPTLGTLVAQYRLEKMPARIDTRRSYEVWLRNHIMPTWGAGVLSDLQARPVELWLQSLKLSAKSRVHIRGMLSILWDFAMWRGDMPTQRNPMELVTIKGATKGVRNPAKSDGGRVREVRTASPEPFRTMALLCCCLDSVSAKLGSVGAMWTGLTASC